MTKSRFPKQRSVAVTISAAAILLIAVLLGSFALGIAQLSHGLAETKAVAQLQQQTELVKALLTSLDSTLRGQVEGLSQSFESSFGGRFVLRPDEQIAVAGVETPALYDGDRLLTLETAVVQPFSASTQAAATIFVRSGQDFVRVATTLRDEKGDTALGTALAPDHPAMTLLRAGSPYVGRALLFGKDYMTAYRPMANAAGEVVGALFVGLDVTDSVRRLKDQISALEVGETGYYYALDARAGQDMGMLVLHPLQEGKNILGATDADGRQFIREILEKKQGVIRYPWINASAGETRPRMKVVVYDYLPEWQWVVAGGAYDDELIRDSILLRNVTLGVAVAVVLVLGLLLLLLMRRLVGRPLGEAMAIFGRIGQGRYDNEIQVTRQDEIGALFASLARMQKSLDERTRADARIASEALRIKRALDKASTSMMVVGGDDRVIYVNEALTDLMRLAEDDLRRAISGFGAGSILGTGFDVFMRDAGPEASSRPRSRRRTGPRSRSVGAPFDWSRIRSSTSGASVSARWSNGRTGPPRCRRRPSSRCYCRRRSGATSAAV